MFQNEQSLKFGSLISGFLVEETVPTRHGKIRFSAGKGMSEGV
jgi:hypothetical protein